jgi:hypothetical protein
VASEVYYENCYVVLEVEEFYRGGADGVEDGIDGEMMVARRLGVVGEVRWGGGLDESG